MKTMRKFFKIVIVIFVLTMIGLIITNNSLAWEMDLDSFENKNAGRTGNITTSVIGAIINIVSTVGAGIAIIMLVVFGIKYVSAGSEGKSEIKKAMTSYVIGAIILFGVSGILKILQMFIDANLNNV